MSQTPTCVRINTGGMPQDDENVLFWAKFVFGRQLVVLC